MASYLPPHQSVSDVCICSLLRRWVGSAVGAHHIDLNRPGGDGDVVAAAVVGMNIEDTLRVGAAGAVGVTKGSRRTVAARGVQVGGGVAGQGCRRSEPMGIRGVEAAAGGEVVDTES